MKARSSSYLDFLSRVATLLGSIILFVGFVGTFLEWVHEHQKLLIASIVGYVLLAGGIFWFAFKSPEISSKWRWGSLAVLYLITVPFFFWVGSEFVVLPSSSWPPNLISYYDFETDADLEGWVQQVERSNEHAFSGQYALRATLPVQADQETKISLTWQQEFTADVVVGQIYWPATEDVSIVWAQVCVPLQGWSCAGLLEKKGGWDTFVLDLSEMTVGDPPKKLNQLVLPGLHFQGRLRGATGTQVSTIPVYVDTIQIYRDGGER